MANTSEGVLWERQPEGPPPSYSPADWEPARLEAEIY